MSNTAHRDGERRHDGHDVGERAHHGHGYGERPHHGHGDGRRYGYQDRGRRARRSRALEWTVAVVFTVLAVVVLVAALAVLVAVIALQPRTPYIAVRSARLEGLAYDAAGGGTLDAELSLSVVAENGNARTDVSFSDLELRLSFHGMVIAILRADPFAVPRKGELPLAYVARSSGIPLDDGGRAAMDAALGGGVVPFSVAGQARAHWKLGSLDAVRFWSRLRCDLRFFWPNGTALDFSCKSKARL